MQKELMMINIRQKVFKNTAENWITNALSEDIKQAEEVRSILNYTLKRKT